MRAVYRFYSCILLAVAVLVVGSSNAWARSPYAGLGTWVDHFDTTAWYNPVDTAQTLYTQHVCTLFAQTSNYQRNADVVYPTQWPLVLAANKANGIKTVAWYFPGLKNLAKDKRRVRAAMRLGANGFALDIEADVVENVTVRNRNLIRLSRYVKREAKKFGISARNLGAIIPSPRGLKAVVGYWPDFPYRQLARYYKVFLPMSYFTYAKIPGADYASKYVGDDTAIIREEIGVNTRIHVIGGIADEMSLVSTQGFSTGIKQVNPLGASAYDYLTTRAWQWPVLRTMTRTC